MLNNVQIKAVGSIQKKIKIVLLAVADKTGTAAAVCSDNSWLFFNALNSTPLKKIYKKKCLDLLCWVIPQKRIESCGRVKKIITFILILYNIHNTLFFVIF